MKTYKPKRLKYFEDRREPASIGLAYEFVDWVRETGRLILTRDDVFAARELLPLVVDELRALQKAENE